MAKQTTVEKLVEAITKEIEIKGDMSVAASQRGMIDDTFRNPEQKREKFDNKIAKLQEKLSKQTAKVRMLTLLKKKEDVVALEAEIQQEEEQLVMEALNIDDQAGLQKIIDAAHTVINLKSTRLIITNQEQKAEELLRRVVSASPTGWTVNENVHRQYKYLRIGRLAIVLQDAPRYSISFDSLVAWIGLTEAMKFAKVDVSTLTKAIDTGKVRAKPDPKKDEDEGKVLTLIDWESKRVRAVGQPKVVIKEDDAMGRGEVLIVRPELLAEPIDNLINLTDLTGHEINPLVAADVQVVAQIRGFSGEQLMSIPGIGSTRAKKIIDAISALSIGPNQCVEL